jgi:type I restriction enzyme S subunit
VSQWRPLKRFCHGAPQYGLNVAADQYVGSGIRLMRTTDLTATQGASASEGVYLEAAQVPADYLLADGDLLFSRSGSLGRCLRYSSGPEPSTFAGYLVRFRPLSKITSRYLAYCAQTSFFQETVNVEAVTSTISNFNAERYANVMLPWRSIESQRAIADFLDAETARIDALIAKKRKLLSVIEERASRLLNELFSVDHILDPLGVPISFRAHTSVRLGYLAQVQTGLTLDAQREVGNQATTLPYLRVANVQDGRLDLAEIKTVTVPRNLATRCLLMKGDVLMTEGGDPDKLGRGTVWPGSNEPFLHQNHVFAVRPDPRRLLPGFLALVTRTSYARRYFEVTASKTTGIASTSSDKIAAFRVPLPPLTQQRALLDRHRRVAINDQELKARLNRQLSILQEHRQALITAAVTGELDIPGVAA